MKTEGLTFSNQMQLAGRYFPWIQTKKGEYKGNAVEYGDPRKKLALIGGKLKRTQPLPTSAQRRARPQNPSVFRLVKMVSGESITIATHVEPENFKREQPALFDARYTGLSKDTQVLASGKLSPTMMLTANESTMRATGASDSSSNYAGTAQEPWMRGNTRRFGNKGMPWVANSAPACGGAPGISEEQVGSWSMQSHRISFSSTSLAANTFVPRIFSSSSLPAIRGGPATHA